MMVCVSSFTSDRPFSLKKIPGLSRQFTHRCPFGAKVFSVSRKLETYLQLSGKRCTLDAVPSGTKSPVNQLVFIGRNLNADQIQQGLSDCLEPNAARLSTVKRVE